EHIKTFANGGGWAAFLAFLPMGIVFGAVHAMTPGHSKAVLAAYLTGASAGMRRGLMVSLALSATHVTMAVLIALLPLPLVSVGFMAGLIPCPLTLFVMTFAMSRGVPEAGIMFALVMMTGVALTLSGVALATVFFRRRMERLLADHHQLLARASKAIEAAAGGILVAVAIHEIFSR
ncbi:ABC transporter permease, partial [Sinorhizobium medicae]|uniref:HoxN/HupN/NixA family nickel/cobalt transporter n=1 Tax=Sinorhizobium medicae TaxID=110321 RepID=UPI000C7A5992